VADAVTGIEFFDTHEAPSRQERVQSGWRISGTGAAPTAAHRNGESAAAQCRQRSGQLFAV